MKKTHLFSQQGLTLVELLVVLSLFTILILVSNINLTPILPKANLKAAAETFITDLRSQQLAAMSGYQPLNSNGNLGVHLDQSSYVLFNTPVYDTAESSNTLFSLNQGITFSLSGLPSNDLIFEKTSGELINPSPAPITITLTNATTNEQATIQLNRLGVVESISY